MYDTLISSRMLFGIRKMLSIVTEHVSTTIKKSKKGKSINNDCKPSVAGMRISYFTSHLPKARYISNDVDVN